jgi:hypothetical protein
VSFILGSTDAGNADFGPITDPTVGELLSWDPVTDTFTNEPAIGLNIGAPWTGVDVTGATETSAALQAFINTYGQEFALIAPAGAVFNLQGTIVIPHNVLLAGPPGVPGTSPVAPKAQFNNLGDGFIEGIGGTVNNAALSFNARIRGFSITQSYSGNFGAAIHGWAACGLKDDDCSITGSWYIGRTWQSSIRNEIYRGYISLDGTLSAAAIWLASVDTDVWHIDASHIDMQNASTPYAAILIDGCATGRITTCEGESAANYKASCTVTGGSPDVTCPNAAYSDLGTNIGPWTGFVLGTTILDVVAPVTITITGATGGTFTIQFNNNPAEEVTAAWNVPVATLQSDIQALGGAFAAYTVTGTAGASYVIAGPANNTQVGVNSSALTPSSSSASVNYAGYVASTNWTVTGTETLTLPVGGNPAVALCNAQGLKIGPENDWEGTSGVYISQNRSPVSAGFGEWEIVTSGSGTYTITIGGQTTAPIAIGANDATVTNALKALAATASPLNAVPFSLIYVATTVTRGQIIYTPLMALYWGAVSATAVSGTGSAALTFVGKNTDGACGLVVFDSNLSLGEVAIANGSGISGNCVQTIVSIGNNQLPAAGHALPMFSGLAAAGNFISIGDQPNSEGVLTDGSFAANGHWVLPTGAGSAAVMSSIVGQGTGGTTMRHTARTSTTNAPGATPSADTDNFDLFIYTGLAASITSMTTGLTGTPNLGDSVTFVFTDNNTPRNITWGSSFEASGTIALPTGTTASTPLTVGFKYGIGTAGKWHLIGVS